MTFYSFYHRRLLQLSVCTIGREEEHRKFNINWTLINSRQWHQSIVVHMALLTSHILRIAIDGLTWCDIPVFGIRVSVDKNIPLLCYITNGIADTTIITSHFLNNRLFFYWTYTYSRSRKINYIVQCQLNFLIRHLKYEM